MGTFPVRTQCWHGCRKTIIRNTSTSPASSNHGACVTRCSCLYWLTTQTAAFCGLDKLRLWQDNDMLSVHFLHHAIIMKCRHKYCCFVKSSIIFNWIQWEWHVRWPPDNNHLAPSAATVNCNWKRLPLPSLLPYQETTFGKQFVNIQLRRTFLQFQSLSGGKTCHEPFLLRTEKRTALKTVRKKWWPNLLEALLLLSSLNIHRNLKVCGADSSQKEHY